MAEEQTIPEDIRKMSFEEALEELKGIVERLERGDEKLEQSIESYQRGAALKRHCEDKLKQAQARIDKIQLGPDGSVGTEPLDVE